MTIALGTVREAAPRAIDSGTEEDEMKNSQLAVLSAVILAGPLIVAGSNWWLVQSVRARPVSNRAVPTDKPIIARHDAEGQGRPVLRQLPRGGGRSRKAELAST